MIDCFKCVHFYITWDKAFPYGCKLMSFKSKRLPSREVYIASSEVCRGFENKDGRNRPLTVRDKGQK